MEHRIAVTGPTGTVGGSVARILAAEGVPLVLPVRSPDQAPHLRASLVREASYADVDAAVASLAGVELLFMVSASEEADRVATHRSFVDAAREAGVGHIVYTSFLDASPNATFLLARDHWHTEEYLRESGLSCTFLRDNLYLDLVPALAGADGVIRGPAGAGRLSAVAQADVARSAAAVLRAPGAHAGKIYHLTGPEAFTLAEAAATITDLTPATVRFEDQPHDEAIAARAHYGAPGWQVEAWVSTYTAIARGELAELSPDVERLTGRRPISLRDLLTATG